ARCWAGAVGLEAESGKPAPGGCRATAGDVVGFPTPTPPAGPRHLGVGLKMRSATTSPGGAAAATASDQRSGQKESGTPLARLRAVNAPKTTMTVISATTRANESVSKITVITY